MKMVVLDGYAENPGDLSWDALSLLGELIVYDRTPSGFVADRIGDADAAFTNKVPITAETIAKCANLHYIGVLATGYNIVDIEAAKRRSITVCNVPTYGTASVSQQAIALLLEICNQVGLPSKAVMKGEWHDSPDWSYAKKSLVELANKTIGIVGYGRIGRATGRIAQALGMSVIAYDVSMDLSLESDKMRYVTLDELYELSDVIVLHCPLNSDNYGMICEKSISKMKDGVIFINNSRGLLVVEQDLADALNRGKIAAAGVDVVSEEPINDSNPLLYAKNCCITPHIAWATFEARQTLIQITVKNIASYLNGVPINVV